MRSLQKYVAVWRVPGAPLLLVVGTFARVGIGMISLSLLLLVHESTGSYGAAAIAALVALSIIRELQSDAQVSPL